MMPPQGTGRSLLAPTPTEVLSCSILVQGTRPFPERSPLPFIQLGFLTRKGMINVDFWSVDSTSIASFFLPT
jgi:hypothetical protein